MKSEREKRQEIINQVLDGGLDQEQLRELKEVIESDAVLKEEFIAVEGTLQALKNSERSQAPAFFTHQVMRGLPKQKPDLRERARAFLFKGRMLRWNMATAFAVLVIAALAFTVLPGRKGNTVNTALQPGNGQVVVTMNLYAPEAKQVAVAGTFNKWRTDENIMGKDENGLWTISIPLKPGDYTYMFIVDGKAWVTDPHAEAYRDDGFGNKNAFVRVKT